MALQNNLNSGLTGGGELYDSADNNETQFALNLCE